MHTKKLLSCLLALLFTYSSDINATKGLSEAIVQWASGNLKKDITSGIINGVITGIVGHAISNNIDGISKNNTLMCMTGTQIIGGILFKGNKQCNNNNIIKNIAANVVTTCTFLWLFPIKEKNDKANHNTPEINTNMKTIKDDQFKR